MRRVRVPLVAVALSLSSFAYGQTGPSAEYSREAGNTVLPFGSSTQPVPATGELSAASRLTLGQVLEASYRRNPLLVAAELEIAATEGAVLQAGLRPNPSVDVEETDVGRNLRETRVLLSQPIELGGKRGARLELARRDRALAEADRSLTRLDVRSLAFYAFFDTLIGQERVRVAEESVRIASDAVSVAARRVTAGKVSPIEETRARVVEAGARIELRQAISQRSQGVRALSAVTGIPQAEIGELEGRPDQLPIWAASVDVQSMIAMAPTVRRAQLVVDRAQAAYELERARRIPDITLSVGTTRSRELGRDQPIIGFSIPRERPISASKIHGFPSTFAVGKP